MIFLKLESSFCETCERSILEAQQNEENGYFPAECYLKYMRQTAATAAELQLGILHDFAIPDAAAGRIFRSTGAAQQRLQRSL